MVVGIIKIKLWLFVFYLVLISEILHAERLAVVYPEIREPYRQIFLNIYKGIETSFEGQVSAYVLEAASTSDDLLLWLNQQKMNGAIVLGNRSMRTALSLPSSTLRIVGAVLIQPDDAKLSTITLVPSPNVVFKKLVKVLPKINRVHVVYRRQNAWFIETSTKEASKHSLKILAHGAGNAREMAYLYRQVLNNMEPGHDVLWIAPYGRSPDKAILKVILQEAWRKKLPVISSSLADVKRGALFSFYTNNIEMGKELVNFWKSEQQNTTNVINVQPTESIEIAVNLRTANHLDLFYSKKNRKAFGLMYPTPQDR